MVEPETSSDNEKMTEESGTTSHKDFTFEDIDIPAEGTPERLAAERRILRKLDRRVLPTIIFIYIMNYIDRVAITAARLKGLEADLGLTDLQYNIVLSILFASYCPAQIPSNMILNYITRPSFYIGGCVVAWGFASAMAGVSKTFSHIAACRVFLGLPEAAFYPGAVYLLSRWYTRKELAFRAASLFSGLLISNAFGSLMAAGILSEMEGKRGIRAWRWLFFIEGAITIALGFLSMWLLPDYPHNTRWMTPYERRIAQARLAVDAGEADRDNEDDSPVRGLILAVKDPRVWLFAFMNVSQILGLSFGNFFPTLTQTLGYNTTITLVLAAPPWIYATLACLANSWHADRTGERYFHITLWSWGAVLAYIISLSTMSTGGRYLSMFMMASGYAGFSMTLVWVSNVIPRPPAKRAAAIGIVNGFGNLGNLMGSYTWKAIWGPEYHPSMGISLGGYVLSIIIATWIRHILVSANKKLDADEHVQFDKLDRKRVEDAARLEGITFDQAMEKRRGFRFLY